MGEIAEVYLNNLNYQLNGYTSDWFEMSSISFVTFSSFSSGSTYTMLIEYSVDRNYEVVKMESKNSVLGELCTLISNIICKYIRFKITSFTPNNDLKLQAFISVNSDRTLGNIGNGIKIYDEDINKIRSFISSDNSVSVTQNADTIDVKTSSSPSPWVRTGTDVILTTTTDQVSIGGASSTHKLEVVDLVDNDFTCVVTNNSVNNLPTTGGLLVRCGLSDEHIMECQNGAGNQTQMFINNLGVLYTRSRINIGTSIYLYGDIGTGSVHMVNHAGGGYTYLTHQEGPTSTFVDTAHRNLLLSGTDGRLKFSTTQFTTYSSPATATYGTEIYRDGSGNLTFTDALTGTKTLAQLSSGSAVPIPLMCQAVFSGGTYTSSGIGSGAFLVPVFSVTTNNDKSGSPYIDTSITNGLKYIGISSQIVQLAVTLSEEFLGSGPKQVDLRVYKNGVTILAQGQAEFDKRGWTSYTFQFSIATNDLIQLWADNLTDNVEMTIYQLIFSMTGTGY